MSRARFSSTSPAALARPPTAPGYLRRLWLRMRLWHLQLTQVTLANDMAVLREGVEQDEALLNALQDRRIKVSDRIIDISLELGAGVRR